MTLNQLQNLLLKNKDETLQNHTNIVDLLRRSRFLDWLRLKGSWSVFSASDPTHVQANKGAFAAGYNQCLDDLLGFTDRYILAEQQSKAPQMNFGSDKRLLQMGYTKEEIELINIK